MKFEGVPNYYHTEKITRVVGNGFRQDWYGVRQGEKNLVCAKCGGTHKVRKLFAVHEKDRGIIAWKCECGNFEISVTHKPETDTL